MGIAPSAVRWYADNGLLPCERVAGNQRRFFADVLCRVAMIRAAQRVGLTLGEIREALRELPSGQVPTRGDWARLAARLRAELVQRIDRLFELLAEFTEEAADRDFESDGDGRPVSPDRRVLGGIVVPDLTPAERTGIGRADGNR